MDGAGISPEREPDTNAWPGGLSDDTPPPARGRLFEPVSFEPVTPEPAAFDPREPATNAWTARPEPVAASPAVSAWSPPAETAWTPPATTPLTEDTWTPPPAWTPPEWTPPPVAPIGPEPTAETEPTPELALVAEAEAVVEPETIGWSAPAWSPVREPVIGEPPAAGVAVVEPAPVETVIEDAVVAPPTVEPVVSEREASEPAPFDEAAIKSALFEPAQFEPAPAPFEDGVVEPAVAEPVVAWSAAAEPTPPRGSPFVVASVESSVRVEPAGFDVPPPLPGRFGAPPGPPAPATVARFDAPDHDAPAASGAFDPAPPASPALGSEAVPAPLVEAEVVAPVAAEAPADHEVVEPPAIQAEVVDPVAVEPEVALPEVVEPEVVEPEVVEPEVVEPEVVESVAAEAEVAEAEVAEAEVAEAEVVEPEVVEPEGVEPEVVETGVVETGVVEPGVVEPGVVEPVAAEAEVLGVVEPSAAGAGAGVAVPEVVAPLARTASEVVEAQFAAESGVDSAAGHEPTAFVSPFASPFTSPFRTPAPADRATDAATVAESTAGASGFRTFAPAQAAMPTPPPLPPMPPGPPGPPVPPVGPGDASGGPSTGDGRDFEPPAVAATPYVTPAGWEPVEAEVIEIVEAEVVEPEVVAPLVTSTVDADVFPDEPPVARAYVMPGVIDPSGVVEASVAPDPAPEPPAAGPQSQSPPSFEPQSFDPPSFEPPAAPESVGPPMAMPTPEPEAETAPEPPAEAVPAAETAAAREVEAASEAETVSASGAEVGAEAEGVPASGAETPTEAEGVPATEIAATTEAGIAPGTGAGPAPMAGPGPAGLPSPERLVQVAVAAAVGAEEYPDPLPAPNGWREVGYDTVVRAVHTPWEHQPYHELGLQEDEYAKIRQVLGRRPTESELAMYAIMWSEHCSYKSSKVHLRQFAEKAPPTQRVLAGIGENAGVVRVSEKLAVTFKVESHNHPSFVEPHQGAATGVGGIVRDILAMGARPVAVMDPLRFGAADHEDTKRVLPGVVSGIGGYGNCLGLPNIGGEVVFDPCYQGNPLVNALCVGVLPVDRLQNKAAAGPGNVVVLIGAKTGRDGIGGVSVLASATFSDGSEKRRPSVQVGDPFVEKLLIEACLEIYDLDLVVGIQDLGGAGLTCALSETAAAAGTGMAVNLDLVPLREASMTPHEVLSSESQERMLLIVTPENLPVVLSLCARWGVLATAIGEVTPPEEDGGRLRIWWRGEVVVDVPPGSLADDGPIYARPMREPNDRELMAIDRAETLPRPETPAQLRETLLRMVASPNLCDKSWVTEQYDRYVLGNTVLAQPEDAGVLRIDEKTGLGVALSVDGNGRYARLDPYNGARLALAEAYRNVAVTGATPVAVTNCLNFGSPEDPGVMWQFAEAVRGLADACQELGIPVTGGNVSFYNQTGGAAIHPTPIVGVLGLMSNVAQRVPMGFAVPGDQVFLLGETREELGGSEWAHVTHQHLGGTPPAVDLGAEQRLATLMSDAARSGHLTAAHDLSEGGLAQALVEACLRRNVGVRVALPAPHGPFVQLFSESTGRVLVSVRQGQERAFTTLARERGVPVTALGHVVPNPALSIESVFDLSLDELRAAYMGTLPALFG